MKIFAGREAIIEGDFYPGAPYIPVLQVGDIRRGFPPNQVFAVVQCIGG